MLQLIPPSLSNLEAKIRAIGAGTLPTGNSFWFEDLPQIPSKLSSIPFQVVTDRVGEVHELWLDGALKKKFVPQTSSMTLPLILNRGIYEATLKGPGKEQVVLSFQVSTKELIWWSWIQQLVPMFSNLEAVEARLNSPLHIMAYEITLPPSLTALQSSQFSVRNFARSSFSGTIKDSFLVLSGGLFNTPVKELDRVNTLRDRRADYSQILLPVPYQCISRKAAFLSGIKDYTRIGKLSWSSTEVAGKDPDRNVLYVPSQVEISLEVTCEDGSIIPAEDANLMRTVFMDERLNALHMNTRSTVYRKENEKALVFVAPKVSPAKLQNKYLSLIIKSKNYDPRVTPIALKGINSGIYTYYMAIKKKNVVIRVLNDDSAGWRLLACTTELFVTQHSSEFDSEVVEILSYQDGVKEIAIDTLIANGFYYYRLEGNPRFQDGNLIVYPYTKQDKFFDENTAKGIYPMLLVGAYVGT